MNLTSHIKKEISSHDFWTKFCDFYKSGSCKHVVLELVVESGENDRRTLKSVLYDFVNHDYVFFVKTHH